VTGGLPLEELVGYLDAAGVRHMVVGSFASSEHGVPRATRDLDLIIETDLHGLRSLLAALDDERYYVPREAAEQALEDQGQFNVIDMRSGWKIDLIVRKRRPFSESEFGRRTPIVIEGVQTWVASPEDTVLSKLEWAKLGGSERQLIDVAEVLAARGDEIDAAYLDRWAPELGVVELLEQARGAAQLG
jgi:hypothetical protein